MDKNYRQHSFASFIYALAIGVICGVACALTFSLGVVYLLVLAGSALALIALGALMDMRKPFLVAVFILSAVLGLVRADAFHAAELQETISLYPGKAVIVGTVANDPTVSGAHLQASVAVVSANGTPATGKVLAFFPPNVQLAYGQPVAVRGVLGAPSTFIGDNGNIFDYPTYLRVQGISMLLTNAQLNSAQPAPLSMYSVLYFIKHVFDASIEKVLPAPDAQLLEGILLGQRKGLPINLTNAFVISGLIHIVILSGYSMSVVSQGIVSALGFLPRRAQMLCAAVCMVAFVIMTGAAATTVRACAMALVALAARYFHRSALALRSLSVVGAAMVLYNPPLILGDASFFTSVLATFGLIAFSPGIEQLLWRIPQKYDARAIITSTIAVQIFALPALLYFTGNLSFLSVPANLLVLPLLPLVMIAGLMAGMLGLVNASLALVPAVVADLFLKWIQLVAGVTAAIPFSAATLTAFPLWLAVVLYIPLTALAMYLLRRNAAL